MTRTRHEPDFKLRIVREALETRNASLVARRHSVAPNLVARWVRQYSTEGESEFSAKRHSSRRETPEWRDVQQENEQLKKLLGEKDLEIAILRDLLKKQPDPEGSAGSSGEMEGEGGPHQLGASHSGGSPGPRIMLTGIQNGPRAHEKGEGRSQGIRGPRQESEYPMSKSRNGCANSSLGKRPAMATAS